MKNRPVEVGIIDHLLAHPIVEDRILNPSTLFEFPISIGTPSVGLSYTLELNII
jgi:hypothetical protein|nr:MAG TPA: hypothetical protein [Crassvirales sp.]